MTERKRSERLVDVLGGRAIGFVRFHGEELWPDRFPGSVVLTDDELDDLTVGDLADVPEETLAAAMRHAKNFGSKSEAEILAILNRPRRCRACGQVVPPEEP